MRLQIDATSRRDLLRRAYRVVLGLLVLGLILAVALSQQAAQIALTIAIAGVAIGERMVVAGRDMAASRLLIYLLSVIIFILAWTGEGIDDSAIFLCGPLMVLAVIFLPLREYVLSAVWVAVAIVAIGIGTMFNGVQPWYGRPSAVHIWPDIAVFLFAHFANVFMLNSIVSRVGRFVVTERNRLAEESANWHQAAFTDVLSGVFNRRGFMDHAERQHRRAQDERTPLALLMIDIDYFKVVNDTYGHAIGDRVIQDLAEKLRIHFRSTDICGRLGGEEFCVLLTGVDYERAHYSAERFRCAVAALAADTTAGEVAYTISIGFAWMKHQESLSRLMQIADKALYRAKQQGRNCVLAGDYWDKLTLRHR